ncbi:MAG: cyclic lactone autoinducer peptide [Chitinophagales bacterium]
MKRWFGSFLLALVTVLALSGVAGACRLAGYQPPVPESLRD